MHQESLATLDQRKTNRLDALLALRGFACFMVVVQHCSPPRQSIVYHGYDFSWLLFSHYSVAVPIFFCLSGYLMGKAFYTERYSISVEGVTNFWRNRILRIFPLYYFTILILVIFVYPDFLKIENWGYLFKVLTFTYNLFELNAPQFNGVIWSLGTELQFYIFVPFIFSFLKERPENTRKVLVVSLVGVGISLFFKEIAWVVIRNQTDNQWNYWFLYIYTPLITNLDTFLIGFSANALIKNCHWRLSVCEGVQRSKAVKISASLLQLIAVVLVILLYLFSAFHLYHEELWGYPGRVGNGIRTSATIFIMPLATALVTTFFIFSFESGEAYFQRVKKLSFGTILQNPIRVLEIFGTLSYGIYIWHFPILTKISSIFTSSVAIEGFYKRLATDMVLSILVAAVTYYLVELPAARLKFYKPETVCDQH